MEQPRKENNEQTKDEAVAIMMFGKNAKLITETIPALFRMYGLSFPQDKLDKK